MFFYLQINAFNICDVTQTRRMDGMALLSAIAFNRLQDQWASSPGNRAYGELAVCSIAMAVMITSTYHDHDQCRI